MLKVLATQADDSGCGRFRIARPAAEITRQGLADVQIVRSLTADLATYPDGTQEVVRVNLPTDPDVVVIQRPMRMLTVSFIRHLKQRKKKVIVEIDDDVTHLPPKHPLSYTLQRSHPTEECSDALLQACELADLVTTTTPALAKVYAPHGRYALLPNCLPQVFLDAAEIYDEISVRSVVGYAGAGGYHHGDLEEVGKGLQWAQGEADFRFVGLGGDDFPKRFRVTGSSEEWREMDDYSPEGYVAYLSRFDVGLAPLRACLFNEGKSDLKLLEYAALGIPMVASPTSEYVRMAAELPEGSCTIARTPREWKEAVLKYVTGDTSKYYKSLREYAATRTFEARAKDWVEVWQSVM